jgi:dolichol-phosphate mannosyltransferase|tara:strand:+ start:109 stop:243 length:135 start_codon:yes stop_codon:yes gene_type:complete
MDSDFSHNPNDIPRLLKAVSDGADIAIGSRYLNGVSVVNWPEFF